MTRYQQQKELSVEVPAHQGTKCEVFCRRRSWNLWGRNWATSANKSREETGNLISHWEILLSLWPKENRSCSSSSAPKTTTTDRRHKSHQQWKRWQWRLMGQLAVRKKRRQQQQWWVMTVKQSGIVTQCCKLVNTTLRCAHQSMTIRYSQFATMTRRRSKTISKSSGSGSSSNGRNPRMGCCKKICKKLLQVHKMVQQ